MTSKQHPAITKVDSFSRGTVVGNYIITGKIGEGSFGKVMLGVHRDTQKKVALKFIEMKNTKVINTVIRETKLQRLLDHPNIVRLYEVMQVPESNATCMVLEYIEGGELFDYIVTRGRVEEKDAIRLFRQMISAVEYCHQNLVVHRDLKPENILLDEGRNAKIMDFGLANMMQSGQFLHTNCGSPIYSSPEILSSQEYIGPEVDIWSLGIILYVMVTGMCPWSGTNLTEQLKNAVVARFEPPEGVTEECSQLISRILTLDPKKRPTIEEIRHHPWVNRGYNTKPQSAVPSQRHIKPTSVKQLDEEVLNQMVDVGFNKDSVINDLLTQNTTQQSFVLYYLMLDHKEKQQKKTNRATAMKTWSPSDYEKLTESPTMGSSTDRSSASNRASDRLSPSSERSPEAPRSRPHSGIHPAINPEKGLSPSTSGGSTSRFRSSSGGKKLLEQLQNSLHFEDSNSSHPEKLPPIVVHGSKEATDSSSPRGLSTSTPVEHPDVTPRNPGSRPNSSSSSRMKRLSVNLDGLFSPGKSKSPQTKKAAKPKIVKKTMVLEKTTNKPAEEVQAEVERTLNKMSTMTFKSNGMKYSCKEEIVGFDKLKFEVEICQVEKEESIGLSFKRKSGSVWHYQDAVKRFCNCTQL